MKKLAKKTLFRSLASACLVGLPCCSAMVFGQQLQPLPQSSTVESLPPIVSVNEWQDTTTQTTDKISDVDDSARNVLPPVVAVGKMMPAASGIVPSPPIESAKSITTGRNFPADAQEQIAQFIRSSEQAEIRIENTAFSPPLQDQSPSDQRIQVRPRQFNQPIVEPLRIGGQPGAIRQPGINNPSTPMTQNQGIQITQGAVAGDTSGYFDAASPDGYDSEQFDYGPISSTFDCCGFICDARNYLIIDGLFWEREDGGFRASNITFVDDFDSTWGGRITWGVKRDGTRGKEASYMHFDPWRSVSNQFSPGGSLIGGIFGSAGGLGPGAFSAFRNSTYMEQFHKTDLHSVELNKTWWGSDVAKAFIGARFIHFDDEFHMSAANTLGQRGIHTIDTTNNLFGLHGGGEVLYDIGYRLSFSMYGKLGIYGDYYTGRTGLLNNGTVHVNNRNEGSDIAFSADLGVTARYKLSPNARLRFGYDAFALYDIRDVESNFSTVVTPLSGTSYADGDAFFHGASLGIEIYR